MDVSLPVFLPPFPAPSLSPKKKAILMVSILSNLVH